MNTRTPRRNGVKHPNEITVSPLRVLRRAAQLTQQQLADAAGIDIAQVSRFESGISNLANGNFQTVTRIAWALHLPADELVTFLRAMPKAITVPLHEAVGGGE